MPFNSVPNIEVIQSQFQMAAKFQKKRSLVIGCGREIEKGWTSVKIPNSHCSMNRTHMNDVLIDIDERSKPDITMDFGLWEQYALHMIAPNHFERIDFEYLSKGAEKFADTDIIKWLNGADKLLAVGGEIAFINGHDHYVEMAVKYLSRRGNYKICHNGLSLKPLKGLSGQYFMDKNGIAQEHRYCLARKIK